MHSADLKTSPSARTIKLDDGPLRIEDIIDIAEGRPVSYYPIRMKSALALTEGGFPRRFAARRGYDLWCHHRLRRFVPRDGPTALSSPYQSKRSQLRVQFLRPGTCHCLLGD
jgi:hypothetical protein